jgi:hypothetical protein
MHPVRDATKQRGLTRPEPRFLRRLPRPMHDPSLDGLADAL